MTDGACIVVAGDPHNDLGFTDLVQASEQFAGKVILAILFH
jgi:hypothetical protein